MPSSVTYGTILVLWRLFLSSCCLLLELKLHIDNRVVSFRLSVSVYFDGASTWSVLKSTHVFLVARSWLICLCGRGGDISVPTKTISLRKQFSTISRQQNPVLKGLPNSFPALLKGRVRNDLKLLKNRLLLVPQCLCLNSPRPPPPPPQVRAHAVAVSGQIVWNLLHVLLLRNVVSLHVLLASLCVGLTLLSLY